jgi:MHS family shikimate/dehydroshikimate transporter-like MFS transporter
MPYQRAAIDYSPCHIEGDSMSTTHPQATVAAQRNARSQARKAALGSFIGAVVDWYDFLLYGIVAALVFNAEFFPNVGSTMGTLAAFARARLG